MINYTLNLRSAVRPYAESHRWWSIHLPGRHRDGSVGERREKSRGKTLLEWPLCNRISFAASLGAVHDRNIFIQRIKMKIEIWFDLLFDVQQPLKEVPWWRSWFPLHIRTHYGDCECSTIPSDWWRAFSSVQFLFLVHKALQQNSRREQSSRKLMKTRIKITNTAEMLHIENLRKMSRGGISALLMGHLTLSRFSAIVWAHNFCNGKGESRFTLSMMMMTTVLS